MKFPKSVCNFILFNLCLVGCWSFASEWYQPVFAQTMVTNNRLGLGTESNRSASVRLGDVDGDGDLDAVVANGRHWPQQNFLFLNQGLARFTVMSPLGADRSTTYACELADLDGDGDLDVAIGNDMAPGQILLNDGKGKFTQHCNFGEVSSVRSLTTADVDGDGDVDILATCRGMQNRIYLNDGTAGFETSIEFGTQDDATIDVAVADVNEDGHMDLLLANRERQSCQWLLNDGKTNFSKELPFGPAVARARAVAVGDLNGDQHLDWVTGNIGQPNVVYLGDGTGAATQSFEFGAEDSRTYTLDIADLDNDGDLDIVAGNVGQANSIFFNEGGGENFRAESFGNDQHATYGLKIGDLNNDGLPDIAVANSDALNPIFINRAQRKRAIRGAKQDFEKRELPIGKQFEIAQQGRGVSTGTVVTQQEEEIPFRDQPVYQSTNWPMFRGTGARGVAEGFPLRTKWNADAESGELEGILWESDIPGLGHSSPVVYGDKIFLLTAVASEGNAPLNIEAGGKPTAADDNGEQDWLVLCYNKTNGQEIWRRSARKGKPGATRHAKATHANTSVCVDGKHVLAFLGSEGIHCFDLDGQPLWSRDLGVIDISKYDIGWGFSSSPVIHNDRIVILADDPDNPYVACLSLADGSELWKTSRKEISVRSWGTPLVHEQGETTQVVVNGYPWIVSYDLSNGEELWRIEGGGDNPIPTPFEAHGWFYITNAHGGPAPIYVVDPDSRGLLKTKEDQKKTEEESEDDENSDQEDFIWSVPKGGSYMSTPVVYEDHLYLGNSNGVVRCFDAITGKKLFEKRLGRKAGVIASVVAGDGKIFMASENGTVYVLKAGTEYEVLASNSMNEPCFATPAISEGVIFIRTTKRLVAIE